MNLTNVKAKQIALTTNAKDSPIQAISLMSHQEKIMYWELIRALPTCHVFTKYALL